MITRRKLTVAFVLGAVSEATLLTASPVFAHARYKSSTPKAGEVVATSPARLDITFTQQIQKVSGTYAIDVAHDRGASVSVGAAAVDQADRTKLSVALQAGLAPGRYVVNWKNVSDDDGDPATGAFSFYVGKQPNANDLENDKQLESVGFEDETATAGTTMPATGTTPAPATTRSATTSVAGTQSPGITAATPLPTTTSSGGSSGGSDTGTYLIVAAAVIGGALIGFAGLQYARRRR